MLSDSQFVTRQYQNVLDRAPGTAGLANWSDLLSLHAALRQEVLVGFAESGAAFGNAAHGYVGASGTHAAWLFPT